MKIHSLSAALKCSGITLVTALLLLIPEILYAYGVGISGYRGTGDFSFSSKPFLFPEKKASGNIEKTGGGIVYDTNLAGSFPFNVRFNLNIEETVLDSPDFEYDETLLCFNGDLAYGIGLTIQPAFKIWAGPELRFGIANGEGPDFTKDADTGVIGFGLMMGTNIHALPSFDISLTAGVRVDLYRNTSQSIEYNDLKGHAAYAYLMATIFFRSADDTYN